MSEDEGFSSRLVGLRRAPARRTAITVLLASIVLVALACGAAMPAVASARPRYYLSLGDSLAKGMQPDASGVTVDTNQGYANQLYSIERPRIPGLKLVELGCGGETTESMLTGHGNADAAPLGCHPAGGSQIVAAERFLRAHRRAGEVAFVTLDIGANDVDGCVSEAGIEATCVTAGVSRIEAQIPVILARLRRAAAPGTPMAAMTLYDPFLALYLQAGGQEDAVLSVQLARDLNATLTRDYRAAKLEVATVDDAFDTYRLGQTTTLAGASSPVPVAVARICALTWMCAAAPVGPNFHANKAGYAVIASAFAKALAPVIR